MSPKRKSLILFSVVFAIAGGLSLVLAAWATLRPSSVGPQGIRMEFGQGMRRTTVSGDVEKIQGGITARGAFSRLEFPDGDAVSQLYALEHSRTNSFDLGRPLPLGYTRPVFEWSAAGIHLELATWDVPSASSGLPGNAQFLYFGSGANAEIGLPRWLLLLIGCFALICPTRQVNAWWLRRRRFNCPAFPVEPKGP